MSKLVSVRRRVLSEVTPILVAVRADRRARKLRQRITEWEMRAKSLRTDPNNLLDQIVATATGDVTETKGSRPWRSR